MNKIPAEVREVFWNLDPAKLDPVRDQSLIIGTVLPRGRLAAIRWLLHTYGRAAIRDFVIRDAGGPRKLPDSDRRLWLRALAPDRAAHRPPEGPLFENRPSKRSR